MYGLQFSTCQFFRDGKETQPIAPIRLVFFCTLSGRHSTSAISAVEFPRPCCPKISHAASEELPLFLHIGWPPRREAVTREV
eukprot:scaffold1486_cov314-Pavlova_lutheri.AAC.8